MVSVGKKWFLVMNEEQLSVFRSRLQKYYDECIIDEIIDILSYEPNLLGDDMNLSVDSTELLKKLGLLGQVTAALNYVKRRSR